MKLEQLRSMIREAVRDALSESWKVIVPGLPGKLPTTTVFPNEKLAKMYFAGLKPHQRTEAEIVQAGDVAIPDVAVQKVAAADADTMASANKAFNAYKYDKDATGGYVPPRIAAERMPEEGPEHLARDAYIAAQQDGSSDPWAEYDAEMAAAAKKRPRR